MIGPDVIAKAEAVLSAHRERGTRVAVAESCTGGLVAAALTAVPGSSDVFDRGFVTYSNEAKRDVLGVGEDALDTFGAVSIATAWAMARGCLERSCADQVVSITGIAGPGGATGKKPVGTVVFARAVKGQDPDRIMSDVRHFGDLGRDEIRRQAVICALELLMPVEGGQAPSA